MRKDRRKNFIKRHAIAIWMLAAALLLAAVGSFAAYTNTSGVKRVVSTQGSPGLLFSSNVMQSAAMGDTTSAWGESIVTLIGDNPTVTVTVCNYEQGNAARANSSDISYTFSVTLVDKNGSEITDKEIYSLYSLGDTAFTDATMTAEGTLQRDVADKDSYVIKLAKDYLNEIYLKVSATPKSASASAAENHYLRRIIITAQYSAAVADGWSGSFDYKADVSAEDYDAFNYDLSGNGSGTVTLKWDADKVTISPWFLKELGVTPDGSSVSFAVDSAETPSYYIQFYRACAAPEGETWSDVAKYVSAEFTAAGKSAETND
jgi:hypothetical protein